MSLTKKRKPRSQDLQPTKKYILKAAYHCFAHYGFHSATTRMIGKTAGVNAALLVYRFGSKEKLLQAVIDDFVTQKQDMYLKHVADAVRAVFNEVMSMIRDDSEFILLISNEMTTTDEHYRIVKEKVIDRMLNATVSTH